MEPLEGNQEPCAASSQAPPPTPGDMRTRLGKSLLTQRRQPPADFQAEVEVLVGAGPPALNTYTQEGKEKKKQTNKQGETPSSQPL